MLHHFLILYQKIKSTKSIWKPPKQELKVTILTVKWTWCRLSVFHRQCHYFFPRLEVWGGDRDFPYVIIKNLEDICLICLHSTNFWIITFNIKLVGIFSLCHALILFYLKPAYHNWTLINYVQGLPQGTCHITICSLSFSWQTERLLLAFRASEGTKGQCLHSAHLCIAAVPHVQSFRGPSPCPLHACTWGYMLLILTTFQTRKGILLMVIDMS